jgi:AraC-like DNA-binding protein
MKTKCRFAREWLKSSDLSISDIAQLCGFSDSSHMGRVFKRWQGVSPSEYRRAVRAKLFSANSELRAE